MAQTGSNAYKSYTRGRRQFTVETDFDLGMMFTNGAVDFRYVKTLVNYNMYNGGASLVPRPGLRTSELILPNVVAENDPDDREYHTSEDITIMAAKECIENGKTYRQFILGHPAVDGKEGMLWITTSAQSNQVVSSTDSDVQELFDYNITVALGEAVFNGIPCTYFTAPLTKIHGMTMAENRQVATLIGTFAFGNSFYFINPQDKKLNRTVLKENGIKYTTEAIVPKEIDPSEAVTFGYNMLAGEDAYSFVNRNLAGLIQLTGILPYSTKPGNPLLMTPRKNEEIYFRCYFKGAMGKQYKFTWEWRNVGDSDWSSIQALEQSPVYTIVQGTSCTDEVWLQLEDETIIEELQIPFKAPLDEIMIRIQAYNMTDTKIVEKAMTVGFDFSTEMYGTATNVKQESYNLLESTGMETWKNRLVLWGVPKDPAILFISDVNDPSYFPYPNNISVYEEPIVCVKAFLDSLLIFTTSTVHQVTLNEDGSTWTSVVIQSNLNIEPWDRHLIQVVRNMVFFKSGNYYFMIVPKAQSSTGALALAPISTPIVEFFNNFEYNVAQLLQDTFDYTSEFGLINYYNFLDYEDVHNVYVLYYTDSVSEKSGYLHLDILYNTVSRCWRIYTFEAPHFLYPYRYDATQTGTLASTSLLNMNLEEGSMGTVVSIKNPAREVLETNLLRLEEEGFDFYDLEAVVVRAYDGTDAMYLEETLKDCYYCDHKLIFSNSAFELRSSIIEGNDGFQLVALGSQLLKYGSEIQIFKASNLSIPIWDPGTLTDGDISVFHYDFSAGAVQIGTIVEINGKQYTIEREFSKKYYTAEDAFYIIDVSGGYDFVFNETYAIGPTVTLLNYLEAGSSPSNVLGRCIQLYQFDALNMQDLYLPAKTSLVFRTKEDRSYFGYDPLSIEDSLRFAIDSVEESFLFKNWQFIDTGYRDDLIERNKRYREVQFQLNNTDGINLEFGLEFQLDGQSRLSYYMYETEHVIDESDPNYGLLYVQATPYMNLPLEYVSTPNETMLGPGSNSWILNQSLFPELSLWKVRAPVSGKGVAPRMRLISRNVSRFELMSINWVYRLMNAR